MPESFPLARPLDPIPVEIQGENYIILRDPVGFSEQVVVTPIAYYFLAFCNGKRALREINLEFAKQFRVILKDEDAEKIIEELERHYLLDSERFRRHREEVIEAYRREPVRRAGHAGAAYADNPDALREELDQYFACADGPGVRPAEIARTDKRLLGLIAPHIGIKQGGPCFAWGYQRLCESAPADTYVILGTGHSGLENCYAATRKRFETPLGSADVDADFLDRLEAHYGGDLCADEIHHREEHVIEFQVIFLQHALAGRHDFRIVPILCSFGPEGLEGGSSAEIVGRFCEALRRTIAESKRSVCLIASADLAHVGWRYGDPKRIGPSDLIGLRQDDREMIDVIRAGGPEEFRQNLLRDGNSRRICGFPCIYTMLRALDLREGELLSYGQASMDERNSTVSYASVAFCERNGK